MEGQYGIICTSDGRELSALGGGMKKAFLLLIASVLLLVLGCDFAQPKMDSPTIRLVSIALDYEETSYSPLSATLNDQRALNAQLAFLSSESGYEYEAKLFTQKGSADFAELSYIALREVDDENIEIDVIEFEGTAEAVNLEITTIDNAQTDTYSRAIYSSFPSSAVIVFEDKNGNEYSFSAEDIASLRNYIELKEALNFNEDTYLNPAIIIDGVPLPSFSPIDYLKELESILSELYSKAVSAYSDKVNSSDFEEGHYMYRYKKAGIFNLLKKELERLEDTAKECDITIFQYSGHGAPDIDFQYGGALSFNSGDNIYPYELKEMLSCIPGKKLVIIDSCYSGSYAIEDYETPDTFTEAVDTLFSISMSLDDSIWALCAARRDEVAYDGGEGCCGVFTGAIVKAMGAATAEGEYGTLKFLSPGLPSKNSLWVSDLLSEAKKRINRFRSLSLQYPTGDSIIDLRLFEGLK